MQFTLGMPFLGVLGKFYRNRKGLMVFVWLPWGLTTQNIISLKAQDRIWIGSRLTDTRSAENDWIGADTDPQYRIDASLVKKKKNI